MPTAAKLVAAICFAIVGWLGANAFVPLMGENAKFGALREISALIGLFVGWLVMGPRVGKSYVSASGSGLVTMVVLVFFALLTLSTYLMLQQTTKMVYDGPMNAVLGVFDFMVQTGRKMLVPPVMGLLVLGGVVGGVLAEAAGRRWR